MSSEEVKEDSAGHVQEPKNFEPKAPVNLAPPKYDPISPEELAKCDGSFLSADIYIYATPPNASLPCAPGH